MSDSNDPEGDRSRVRARADFDPHRDPQGRPGLYVQIVDERPREHFPPSTVDRGFPCVVPLELRGTVGRLRQVLDRDREQSFVRLLTARPSWVRGLPSLRARRRDQLRRSAIRVAVLAAVCVGWLAAGVWRAWP